MSDTTGVLKRPLKAEEGHFGLRATSAWIARQAYPVHSPSIHLYSPYTQPRSGWVLVKAALDGGEWKGRSTQISGLFGRQVQIYLQHEDYLY
jgi:hypothetical protein